ncbi:MAG: SipW-dependent-type signal peptide-containing protein [Firmicutes bacterium]|nr:SipW-dependent-type signal peptide-containing protein [Bacillota bacterium]
MKRKFVTIAAAALLAASVGLGMSLAYFHDSKTVTNEFTSAGNNDDGSGTGIGLEEPNWDPDNGSDILPGDVIPKDPTVTNLLGPSYVRFVVTVVDKDAGEVITDPARSAMIIKMLSYSDPVLTADDKISSAELESPDFVHINPEFALDAAKSGDGVYYYNFVGDGSGDNAAGGAIMPGADAETGETVSKVLFNSVVVPTDWDQSDLLYSAPDPSADPPLAGSNGIGNFDIVVTAQAIQAQNLTFATAFDAMDNR